MDGGYKISYVSGTGEICLIKLFVQSPRLCTVNQPSQYAFSLSEWSHRPPWNVGTERSELDVASLFHTMGNR